MYGDLCMGAESIGDICATRVSCATRNVASTCFVSELYFTCFLQSEAVCVLDTSKNYMLTRRNMFWLPNETSVCGIARFISTFKCQGPATLSSVGTSNPPPLPPYTCGFSPPPAMLSSERTCPPPTQVSLRCTPLLRETTSKSRKSCCRLARASAGDRPLVARRGTWRSGRGTPPWLSSSRTPPETNRKVCCVSCS